MRHVLSSLFIMRRRSILALMSFALPTIAFAVSFPDVPSTHTFRGQIEALADRGVVKGNPDGTFKPSGTVNRAELLTMLYRAAGKSPATPSKACFKDVDTSSWFSAVVCDAAKNGYVGGYPDGYFRPANPVNRVESLKMIHTVLGLTVDASASTSPLKAYNDVSMTAWYTPYMASAFGHKVLPISGQEGPQFLPEAALTRGEAAAYIFNGLGLTVQSSSSSTTSSASSTARTSSSATSRETQSAPVLLDVDFPFSDDGSFSNKTSKVYVFTVKNPITGFFKASVLTSNSVQCRLYRIDSTTSFALEYYIGQKVGNTCQMRVAMAAGNYQLEVVPNTKNDTYQLQTNIVTGDGNDGFSQAVKLLKASAKTGYLEVEDYAEFYTFTLTKKTMMTVSVSDSDNTSCLVYPMADVDLFGFSGPLCNIEYEYPAGTYYVGVMRRDERDAKVSFTVRYE
jgi:hypothetical protein